MLEKFYKKKETSFAIVFIVIYVVVNSILQNVSNSIGYEMLFTIPANILIIAVLMVFIKKNDLLEYYGFGKVKVPALKLLFFLPLVVISTVNIWFGVRSSGDVLHMAIYFISMIFAAVLEELLFRGLLFKAMCKDSVKAAFIVTSLTFGLGHIVNLINGREGDKFATITQIFYAVAIGFLFAAVLYVGKSLIPCMISHAVFNSLSTFSNAQALEKVQIPVSVALCLIATVSAIAILMMDRNKPKEA